MLHGARAHDGVAARRGGRARARPHEAAAA
jgi:hypothetical protein